MEKENKNISIEKQAEELILKSDTITKASKSFCGLPH